MVISLSFNQNGLKKSLMAVIDNPSEIREISLDDVSNIVIRRKFILYDDPNHFDATSRVVSNDNLVLSHMHNEDAHFSLRIF